MSTLYFDASALVKLFVREDGTDVARALWDGSGSSATSRVSAIELRAALTGAERSRRISTAQVAEAADGWARIAEALTLVDVDSRLVADACLAAGRYALRALDAIHLASALLLAETPVVVASWDRRLRAAALDAGLGLAPAML